MVTGMIFEGKTDYRRYQADKKVNEIQVTRISSSGKGEQVVSSQNLRVGDVIMLESGCNIPADCIILSTEDRLGQCYISTSNLDGERNLKPKFAPKMTQGCLLKMENSGLKVQCIDPDKDIYNFKGELLDKDNLKNELGF